MYDFYRYRQAALRSRAITPRFETMSRARSSDAALESLCRIEAPEAIDVLGRAILDPEADPVTRWACDRALEAIGNYDALEKLRQVRRARRTRAAPAASPSRGNASP
jgi:hypothetical protein